MIRIRVGLWFGLAVGYVLGAAAGRERYEQIRDAAGRLMGSQPVQQFKGDVGATVGEVASAAGEKSSETASGLTEQVTEAASQVQAKVASSGTSSSNTAPQDTGIEDHTGPPPNLPESTLPSR